MPGVRLRGQVEGVGEEVTERQRIRAEWTEQLHAFANMVLSDQDRQRIEEAQRAMDPFDNEDYERHVRLVGSSIG